jgi:peroxiredoxin
MLAGLLVISRPISAAMDDAGTGKGVTFSGRVVDLENKKPAEGASVVVVRSIPGIDSRPLPPWAGESTIRTDGDGRFSLIFPPEQVAERRLSIVLRIAHPGFVPRKSLSVSLAEMMRGESMGDKPFFETISLERGVEYTGQIVTPGGKPAAGVPYAFQDLAPGSSRSDEFSDASEGQTDTEGRFRLRMPKSHSVALYVTPPQPARASFPYAPYQHFWGTDQPSRQPDVWAPTDFGRIVLSRGVRLSGRMVDTDGQPIAGQTIKAYAPGGRDQHSATTEADGSFSLGPLRPANYLIYGEGQDGSYSVSPDAPALSKPIRVIQPVKVYLKEGVLPEPLVLREVPTVRVEVRFVDPQGKPAAGSSARIAGVILNERGQANPVGARDRRGIGMASLINDPELPDHSVLIHWGVQDRPDAQGRIVFLAPTGLRNASLRAVPFDETVGYKARLDENAPLTHWGDGQFGTLDRDRTITIICYRAPTVLVTVRTDDGQVPDDVRVTAHFEVNGQGHAQRFLRQSNGRFRSRSLMPDYEYEVIAGTQSRAYVTQRVQRINLPEGGSGELTLILRKMPKPPEVGMPVPPFSVKTVDGRELSLAGFRGKTVLIHSWAPIRGLEGLPILKAIHDRFGKDERFVIIGLCLSDNLADAEKPIKTNGLSWPQAVLRDRNRDPIVMDYGAWLPPKSFLIGPDGKLIAKDFQNDQLEQAVAEALGRN